MKAGVYEVEIITPKMERRRVYSSRSEANRYFHTAKRYYGSKESEVEVSLRDLENCTEIKAFRKEQQ